jgi:hypothetical protein
VAFALIAYRYSIWCLRRCRDLVAGRAAATLPAAPP